MFARSVYITLILVFGFWQAPLRGQRVYSDNLAHTFSIVARDSVTGQMGVAVQTHWFAVGTRVAWAEAGVGAIATQSFTNVSFGPRGLALLKKGMTAEAVLKQLIASDEGSDVRQVGIIDSKGRSASWTGEKCIREAGHLVGKNFSAQANLMLTGKVWPAMAIAFQENSGPLAERMLAALEAGQAAGGDIRGRQSAALLVVKADVPEHAWQGREIDLRVDDHKTPIAELKRLLKVHRAYEHMNKGDTAMEEDDVEAALREYGKAEKLVPGNLEMKYWHAVSMANAGMLDQALPIFAHVFARDANWWTLTKRLPEVELLKTSESDLQKILMQKP